MTILSALTLAQLQTFNHVMMELEAGGIFNLSEARSIISTETNKRHKVRRSKTYQSPVIKKDVICPECGQVMKPAAVENGLSVFGCRECRFSMMLPGDDNG